MDETAVPGEYNGPERRQSAIQTHQRLEEALREVNRLNEAATTLATAVVNTAQRTELMQLKADVHHNMVRAAIISTALTVVAIIFLMWFIGNKTDDQTKRLRTNYGVLTCLLGKTEAQRTGDFEVSALIACEQTTRR